LGRFGVVARTMDGISRRLGQAPPLGVIPPSTGPGTAPRRVVFVLRHLARTIGLGLPVEQLRVNAVALDKTIDVVSTEPSLPTMSRKMIAPSRGITATTQLATSRPASTRLRRPRGSGTGTSPRVSGSNVPTLKSALLRANLNQKA